jgi:DNA-directed RNA polymerase
MTNHANIGVARNGGEPPMLEPTAADVARQHELEAEMSALGTARFRAALEEARAHGRESETGYGGRLLANSIVKIAAGIEAYLKVIAGDGRKARLAVAARYLRLLDFDTAAFLAAKGVLDGITKRRRLQGTAVRIGRAFEDEVRFQTFARSEITNTDGTKGPGDNYVSKLVLSLNGQTGDYGHKRAVMVHSMNEKGVSWDDWSEDDVFHLGAALVNIVIETTGIAEITLLHNKKKSERYLIATEETRKWIEDKSGWDEVMCPVFQPMVVPPRDWTTPTSGGYLSKWGDASKLVKTRNRAYLEELASADLTLVCSSLNAIQRTAWRVNPQVLDTMTEVWRSTMLEIGDLPSREDKPKPPKPINIAEDKAVRKLWRRAASKIIRENLKLASKRLQVDGTIRTAEKFKGERAIYFPHNLDFRGRIYSLSSGLTPQGHDVAKGLLMFANGKPLETQRAADWLAIHGSNLWGFDKVSLEARVAWVMENEAHILASAANPLDYLWWAEADKGDKAWQFLAFCFEWAGYKREGLAFVSSLPIALDGSCNGLQHFSAMLRDPVGGAAVNLTPSPKPNDIYQTVSDVTIEKLKASHDPLAKVWLAFGISRKLTKRPVMVVPYGGTRHSCKDYILAYVKETLEANQTVANPFGDEKAVFKACLFLSELVWEAIGEVVIAARDAMGWLQKVSQVLSKEDKPINWTAPSGFKVLQAYPNTADRTVKTMISGQVIQLNLSEDLPTIDKRRQSQGISPNFVHSLDAAALTFTVDAATACGLEQFAMIHDSYGTLAADTDVLRECLRQAFCQMYQFDVLKSFADEIQAGLPAGVTLPSLPAKGSLDINQVLLSDFFFA